MTRNIFTVELPLEVLRVEASKPTLISQKTCEQALGVPRRQYLEALPRFRAAGGEVLELGRLRLVAPDDFVRWLRDQEAAEKGEPGELDQVDAMAAELGLRVVDGGHRG